MLLSTNFRIKYDYVISIYTRPNYLAFLRETRVLVSLQAKQKHLLCSTPCRTLYSIMYRKLLSILQQEFLAIRKQKLLGTNYRLAFLL